MKEPDCFVLNGDRWSADDIRLGTRWVMEEFGLVMILKSRRGVTDDPIPLVTYSLDRTFHERLGLFDPAERSFLSFVFRYLNIDTNRYRHAARWASVRVDEDGEIMVGMQKKDPAGELLKTLPAADRQIVTFASMGLRDEHIARLCCTSVGCVSAARASLLAAVIAANPKSDQPPLEVAHLLQLIGPHAYIHALWAAHLTQEQISRVLGMSPAVVAAMISNRTVRARHSSANSARHD
jgi:hypothetical protein